MMRKKFVWKWSINCWWEIVEWGKEELNYFVSRKLIKFYCSNILIVDDDAFNLNTLELILKKFNLTCIKAYNLDAVNIFK